MGSVRRGTARHAACLSLPDAFLVSRKSKGIILVVENDTISLAELDQAMQSFSNPQSKLLGVVLNKVPRSREGYAHYSYSNAEQPTTI
ncbi:hypothetical protein DERA104750_13190 [Deinococcus radiodurans]|jgi:hypothetical protein|nr:hypothetical protein DRO_B0046 [Deinococcus radiodurans R1 = ATCC 13939 = DSM 20539]